MVQEGKDAGRVIPLQGLSVTLGRPGCGVEGAVEFEESSVSRVHAVLNWREEHACYELSNRSFTNPAQGGGLLADGARIRLGALVAEVRRAGVTPEPEPFMGYLEVVQGPGTGSRYEVRRRRLEIGRSARCEICLPSYALAQEHAILEWYGDQPLLMPMTSGPVLVNGRAIPRGAYLEPHDLVALAGNVSLRWLPAGVADEEPPAADEPLPAAVEEPPPAPPPVRRRWRTASLGARAAFFRALLGRLEAREPIQRAVEEAAAARLPGLARELVLEGGSLAEALGRLPHCFTRYEIGMVAAGEEAGILEAQLGVLAASLQAGVDWRRRLARVLLPAAVALVLAGLAAGLLAPLGVAALVALLLRGGHYVLTRFSGYRRVEEDLVERLPRLGPVLRLRTGGRFLRALGPLLHSGMQVQRAALLAAGCTGSTKHALGLVEAARRLGSGAGVRDALEPTGLLAPEVLAEIGRGEEQGDLPERLAAAAGRLEVAEAQAVEAAFPWVLVACGVLAAALLLVGMAAA